MTDVGFTLKGILADLTKKQEAAVEEMLNVINKEMENNLNDRNVAVKQRSKLAQKLKATREIVKKLNERYRNLKKKFDKEHLELEESVTKTEQAKAENAIRSELAAKHEQDVNTLEQNIEDLKSKLKLQDKKHDTEKNEIEEKFKKEKEDLKSEIDMMNKKFKDEKATMELEKEEMKNKFEKKIQDLQDEHEKAIKSERAAAQKGEQGEP